MVFLAVLRDPSLVHGRLHPARQAVGRAGDVHLDPAAVLPAVARPVASALRFLSPGVQALLLAARDRRPDPRLGRRRCTDAASQCAGQMSAAYYFLHFLVILPLVSAFETPDPLPSSISESVLHGEAAEAAPAGQSKRRGGSVATAAAE